MLEITICHDHGEEITYWVEDGQDLVADYEEFMMDHGDCDVETYEA